MSGVSNGWGANAAQPIGPVAAWRVFQANVDSPMLFREQAGNYSFKPVYITDQRNEKVLFVGENDTYLPLAKRIVAGQRALLALVECQRLFEEALPKFNWGASSLDANAIKLLNDVPLLVGRLLKETA